MKRKAQRRKEVKRVSFLSFLFLILLHMSAFAATSLLYNIFWGPFRVGVAKIQIEKGYYRAITYTVGLGNFFYPYYAEWTTFVDEKGMPVKSEIYSKHGKRIRKKVVRFERANSKVIYQKVLPKVEKPEVVNATYPLYDELSAFVNSFSLDYHKKRLWTFPIMVKGKRCFVKVKFEKMITCPKTGVTKGKEHCLFLLVDLPQRSELLRHSKKVEIYLREDKKFPVLIKGHLPILGSLNARLEKVEEK
jgi:hypothetical protein